MFLFLSLELPFDWPTRGSIEFNNVTLKYSSEMDPVIKSFSLKISPGEKIGICGRTGCGKSSLMNALFGIIEVTEGNIIIDNINITKVAPQQLRSKLSIIPQDVVLFSGSVR